MAQNQTSWSFRPIKDCRGPLPIVELDRWYWLALGRAETMRFGNLSLEFLRYAHRLKQLSSPVWSYGFNSTKRNKNSHIKLTQRVWERERERERERNPKPAKATELHIPTTVAPVKVYGPPISTAVSSLSPLTCPRASTKGLSSLSSRYFYNYIHTILSLFD